VSSGVVDGAGSGGAPPGVLAGPASPAIVDSCPWAEVVTNVTEVYANAMEKTYACRFNMNGLLLGDSPVGKTGIFLHLRSGSLSTRPGLAAAIEAKTARSIPGERSGEYIIPRTPRAAGQPLLVCRSHRGRLYTGFGTRSKEGDLLHRLIRSRHPRSAWTSTTNTSPVSRPQTAEGSVSRWNRPRPDWARSIPVERECR
jgi:hypothetical protein